MNLDHIKAFLTSGLADLHDKVTTFGKNAHDLLLQVEQQVAADASTVKAQFTQDVDTVKEDIAEVEGKTPAKTTVKKS